MSSAGALLPLERASLRERARSQIRAGIVTGQVAAGEIYSVGSFALRLNVSATPVREALMDLANEGLVEVIRNRGFRVIELSEKDMDEIFQIRIMLEPASVAAASGKLSADALGECRRLAEVTEECARIGDLTGFLEADREFHGLLVGVLGNRRLVEIVGRLRDQTRLQGLPALAKGGQLASSAGEHVKLLEAVAAGDSIGAHKRMIRHLEHTRGIWAGRDERTDHKPK